MAKISPSDDTVRILRDGEEEERDEADRTCVSLCFPSSGPSEVTVADNIGISLGTLDIGVKLLCVIEVVWVCVAIVFAHDRGNVNTYTCNSNSTVTADYYTRFQYTCIHRGHFYLAATVIIEPILSVLQLLAAIWFTGATAREFSKHYTYAQIHNAIGTSLLSLVLFTLSGLTLQSTYVYTVLAVFVLCIYPASAPTAIAPGLFVCILATISASLPVASVLFAPDPGQQLSIVNKALIALELSFFLFLCFWWAYTRFRQVSYKIDLWVYIAIMILFRWAARSLLLAALHTQ